MLASPGRPAIEWGMHSLGDLSTFRLSGLGALALGLLLRLAR
ncbi:MAG TPA: hypothetical protein VH301_04750 [Usitatibacter sp.]|nr:hypothetical protein [Usitatibacter sp.]